MPKVAINQVAEHLIKVARNLVRKYARKVAMNYEKRMQKGSKKFPLTVLTFHKKAHNSTGE